MDTNKILSASLLDIVFDNRNKDYGAYELRKTYARQIKKSLIITCTSLTFLIAGAAWASKQKKSEAPAEPPDVTLTLVNETPIPEPPPIEEPPPAQQEPTRTEQFVTPTLADVVEDPPPTQNEIEIAAIGTKDIDGDIDKRPTEVELPGVKTGIIEAPINKEPEGIQEFVSIPAKFDGDWKKFLERNLQADPAINNGAPAGRYSVRIKFVVDKEGNVSDIVPLTNLGYGLEQEAIRVIKKSKKWEPAIQNGYKVKAYHTQIITFEVLGDE